MLEGYSVRFGVPPGAKDQGFTFTLRTPERWFYLSAATSTDRDLWIQAIEIVLEKPLTIQDKASTWYFIYTYSDCLISFEFY